MPYNFNIKYYSLLLLIVAIIPPTRIIPPIPRQTGLRAKIPAPKLVVDIALKPTVDKPSLAIPAAATVPDPIWTALFSDRVLHLIYQN